ncbi:amidohydrolase [Salinifilum aidingensis]
MADDSTAQQPPERTGDSEPRPELPGATAPGPAERGPGGDDLPARGAADRGSGTGDRGSGESSAGGGVARRRFLAGVGATAAGFGLHTTAEAQASGSPGDPPGPERFRADPLLLAPELVLLPDGPTREQAVLVAGGEFRDIGPAQRLSARHGTEPVHLPGQLLMPGFVDAHHHLTQSFGKAQSFGQPSEVFKQIWEPLEQALDEDTARTAAKLAALEALRGGFTTVADAGTRAPVDVGVLAEAAHETGVRCVLGKVCSDGSGGPEHLARWESDRLVHPSLAIPVPGDATAEVITRTAKLCAEAGAVFQIHLNEHLAAVERSLRSHDLRPLEYLHSIDALGPQTLGAHTTLLSAEELRLLSDTGTAISYNPVASAWKGNSVAPANTMAALDVRFGMGTDGTRGDGFRMVDAAETAQLLTTGLRNGDTVAGAGERWLKHATALSAEAVGLGGTTGEIAVGRAADFLLVDLGVPELTPSWDLPWELVRLANRDQITAVVVDGQLRLWHGWPPDWDGPGFVRHAAAVGREVLHRAQVERVDPRARP